MKIHISNQITITGADDRLKEAVKKALTIKNPAYFKNLKMGIKVWPSMMYFKYYKNQLDGSLVVPRGFRKRLLDWCDKIGVAYEVKESLLERRLDI